MTEEDFLAAIRSERDSDGPRLVYADWLQSRGDPYGEHIALSLQPHPRSDSIDDRIRELAIEREWHAHFFCTFARGMPDRIFFDVDKLADPAALALLHRTAPSSVFIAGPQITDAQLRTLCTALATCATPSLELSIGEFSPERLAALLVACPRIDDLLFGPWTRATDAHVAALRPLSSLRFSEGRLTADGARSIARLPLRRLVIADQPIGHYGVLDLARMTGLEQLEIGGTGYTDETIERLVEEPGLSSLRRLALCTPFVRASLTQRGLSALLRARHLQPDLTLVLDGVTLGLQGTISYSGDEGEYMSRWDTKPSGPLSERFRIEIADVPHPG